MSREGVAMYEMGLADLPFVCKVISKSPNVVTRWTRTERPAGFLIAGYITVTFSPLSSPFDKFIFTHHKKTQEKQLIIEISLQKHHIVAMANSNHQPRTPESRQPYPPAPPPPSPRPPPPRPQKRPDRQYHHPEDLVG